LDSGNAALRFPKELTRITSGLLPSRWSGVIPMLKRTTHFEQVPLGTVKKIVEEQLSEEITAEPDRVITKKQLAKGLLAATEPLAASFCEYSKVELSK
jgi:hypothetical protein